MRERVSSRRLGRPLRIVVLDAHDGSRRMLSFILASRGHHVSPAATADEAIGVLVRDRTDAVVFDWTTRSGPLRGLGRQLRSFPSVRVVLVMSSVDQPPNFCAEEEVDAYFLKPCSMGDLANRLETLARTRPSHVR